MRVKGYAGAAHQTRCGEIPRRARVTHIAKGFDFLGQNVRKCKAKLLIKPARKSMTFLITKVRDVLRKNKAVTQSQ